MDKIKCMLLIASILFFSGCECDYYWYKRDSTLKEAEANCRQCYIEARSERMVMLHDITLEAQVTHSSYIPTIENQNREHFDKLDFYNCMKARGYRRVHEDFFPSYIKKKHYRQNPDDTFSIAGQ